MRKRGIIAATGLAAVLVLSVAPGTASAHHTNPDGDITIEQAPATPLAEGVWVPLGGGLGDVSILKAPATPLAEGVWVPLGGGLGDVVIERAPAVSEGVFVPKGGGLGDVTIEEVLSSRHVPAPSPPSPANTRNNTCYMGACADSTLAGAVPDLDEMFGGGGHSYGPQQAIRLGGM